MKTNNVKKILSIIIVSIIVAITVATVVLAIIPKTLYNPIPDGYYTISVYHKGEIVNSYAVKIEPTDEAKQLKADVDKNINKSIKDNLLSSIFQGTGKYSINVVSNTAQENVQSTVTSDKDKSWIVFDYLDEEQTLEINGEVYINSAATTSDKTVKFVKIFMSVANTQTFEECKIYLADRNNKSTYQVKYLAHQSDLYNFITKFSADHA